MHLTDVFIQSDLHSSDQTYDIEYGHALLFELQPCKNDAPHSNATCILWFGESCFSCTE